MKILFDHFALRVRNPEKMKQFLTQLLGLKEGDRPDFSFEGYWLYSQGKPIVHIFGTSASFRSETVLDVMEHSQAIVDHICFSSDDYKATMQTIQKYEYKHSDNIVPNSTIRQIFVMGPENLFIEIQADTH